jgi:exonuclease SbcC
VFEGLEKKLTSDKAVTAAMYDIIGVDKKAINSTVFIKQGEMDRMFGTEAERRDFYMRLLMLGDCEKVAGIVDSFRKQVQSAISDLGGIRDEAEQAFNRSKDRFLDAEDRWKGTDEKAADKLAVVSEIRTLMFRHMDVDGKIADENTRVASAIPGWGDKTADELSGEFSGREKELGLEIGNISAAVAARLSTEKAVKAAEERAANLGSLSELFSERDGLETKIRDLLDSGPSVDPSQALQEARGRLEAAEGIPDISGRLADASKSLAGLEKALADERACEKDSAEKVASILERHTETQREFRLRENLLAAVKGCDDSECPVCGSSAVDFGFVERERDRLALEVSKLSAGLDEARLLHAENTAARHRLESEAIHAAADRNRAENDLETAKTLVGDADTGELKSRVEELSKTYREFVSRQAVRLELDSAILKLTRKIGDAERPSGDDIAAAKAEVLKLKFSLPELPADHENRLRDLDEQRRHFIGLVRDVGEHRTRIERLSADREKIAGEISELLTRSRDLGLQNRFDLESPTVGDLDDAVDDLRAMARERQEAGGAVKEAKKSLDDATDQIGEIEQRIERQKEEMKLAENLGRLAETFKPSGAPMEYVSYVFDKIAETAADYLASAGADFMVGSDPDAPLSYQFLRLDRVGETWLPQSRMSGGQRVWLGVATLRAIHALIMPDVGFVSLDEPTTHLDGNVREAMADMLRRMGEEGTIQMLVCDHSPELVDAFGDTIRITE